VPGFESIIDQEKPIRLLTTFLRKGTIPHALLFTGIEGVGKRTVALIFAMACNCKGEKKHGKTQSNMIGPCGLCSACRKIGSGNHPDILFIKPSGPYIRIDQIRALVATLSMKPYEAVQRVVIISDAQAMNPEAGNALLKILEEPPDRTILILTAPTSELLPTIVSRCQNIRFNPISRKSIEEILIKNQGLRPGVARILATIANGSFSKAVSMHKNNWLIKRNWLINELAGISARPIGSLLAFAEKLSENKDTLQDSLEMMTMWFRDLAVLGYSPDKIINKDKLDQIHQAAKNMLTESLLLKIDAIQSAKKKIRSNANLKLTLEVLAFRLAGIHP
jgi:DNA polymerase-3 subunit delta'